MLPNPWVMMALGVGLVLAGLGGYYHGVKTTADKYDAAIAKGAQEAEKVTREAVEKAREEERTQIGNLRTQSENALIASQSEANAARKRLTDLQRKVQELGNADPSVDAWRNTGMPEPVRVLLRPGD